MLTKPIEKTRINKPSSIFALLKTASIDENRQSWKWQLDNAITSISYLAEYFGIPESSAILETIKKYPVRTVPYYLALADRNDPSDPIRQQILPHPDETGVYSDFVPDPFKENFSPCSYLVHRYPNRVLCVLTDICAVKCRHCTRKNLLGTSRSRSESEIDAIISYIGNNVRIHEVIVSGGDPLVLETEMLDDFLGRIRKIKHVSVIRIGSRIPVTLPMRIDANLCDVLKKHAPIWFNTHFNHARELTKEAKLACAMLVDSGIPVSNQTVLLKNVNDSFESLAELFDSLVSNRVRPYYLFQCDPVSGTGHFKVELEKGIKLMEQLKSNLGGLSIPNFVADLPNTAGKTRLA
ncbi:MAG: KamA family radical SAM protein [Lentisphaerae bacterium]|nr:KamA family radical SAM protein [Lentisphaerota bacterium]